ncbi:hypothetical protein SAMN06269185_0353 [Natronoarchaeum philippinense]|uniref:Uncharacterized protein n=1 Tax=Natronoarchaeum philippinense TaxID=558529 RepID=A0A285N2P2_NATPI|nr:hypothetical protein [Natronoarchaeum philippinense]SNZ03722.1 hypothetical protein SAMN06269185_0353 [Natronoarchaeum philippinense]
MSRREYPSDQSAQDAETGSTFLAGIEFLTGRDPNLGSFLLVVGMVTCVFVALFQFTLPAPVSHLLTAGVLAVTALSAVFGALFDRFGYFEQVVPSTTDSSDRPTGGKPWVPVGKQLAPLPPLINFDADLRAFSNMYDGDLPKEFDPFVADYLRLKTNTGNRATIASDLRADLNPIGTLFEDGSEGATIHDDISERLFRYIGDESDHLTLDRVAFYDEDGSATNVEAINNQLGRVELRITNEGEAAEVDAVVDLYDGDDTAVASRICEAGIVSPGVTKDLDAEIFVPADVERAVATLRSATPDRTVTSA